MNYWVMKSEPSSFSIEDLKKRPRRTEQWDGVRNYQARNFIRDGMRKGDLAFFYHSGCAAPAIVGIVEIVRPAYPDRTALDPENHHYDPRSTRERPIWYMVDVRFQRAFARPLTLARLKQEPALHGMQLLKRGNRLSVMPVSAREWKLIVALADE